MPSHSLSECFELIGELPLHFEFGTEGRYSNTNYFLLGHILEMLTGKPLSAAMSDVFMRFGLNHTHMNGHIADACGYVKHNDEIFFLRQACHGERRQQRCFFADGFRALVQRYTECRYIVPLTVGGNV